VDTERSGPETEHTGVRIAHEEPSPVRQVWRRVVFAALLLLLTVGVIYLDRDGYRDGDDVGLSLLDSFYYATVTLSTTGYGDITPITPAARLVNILLITPLRIMFLLVLIGTTLEALTARSREEFRIRRWRSRVRQHVIVCGYGTKGRSAIRSLQALGTPLDRIVVVDPSPGPSTRPTPSGSPGSSATPAARRCCGGPRSSGPARSSSRPTGTTPRC
jgi:voltage-gated potassium channel